MVIYKITVLFLSHVQLFAAPWTVAHSSVHGIFQARILEWVTISHTTASSWPRDWARVSWISSIGRQILYLFTTWEALIYEIEAAKCPGVVFKLVS